MTYLTRGPGGTPGIGSKRHPSGEPTPVGGAYLYSSGGDGMSRFPIKLASTNVSPTLPQATP